MQSLIEQVKVVFALEDDQLAVRPGSVDTEVPYGVRSPADDETEQRPCANDIILNPERSSNTFWSAQVAGNATCAPS